MSRATEIHTLRLLSYSALIKLDLVSGQRKGETAVSAEGQEEEENDSLILVEQVCVHILLD